MSCFCQQCSVGEKERLPKTTGISAAAVRSTHLPPNAGGGGGAFGGFSRRRRFQGTPEIHEESSPEVEGPQPRVCSVENHTFVGGQVASHFSEWTKLTKVYC